MSTSRSLFLLPLAALLLLGAGCGTATTPTEPTTPTVESDPPPMVVEAEEVETMDDMPVLPFRNTVAFTNVSDMPDATAEAYYDVRDGETRVLATFELDPPPADYFYEGWLVCDKTPYTTNALEEVNSRYINAYQSSDVPEDCQLYVLTIEPDDGDPAPAGHVFDGTIEPASTGTATPDWNNSQFLTLAF